MINRGLLLALGVLAVGAAGMYFFSRRKEQTPRQQTNPASGSMLLVELPPQEKKKYPPALLREFDLIVPPFKASKSAERVANEITAKRFMIDPIKVKSPLYL